MRVASVRDIANAAKNYHEFNREERNMAAVVFAAFCQPGNAASFIASLKKRDDADSGFPYDIAGDCNGDEFGIYFEYAYLRDMWNQLADGAIPANEIKKNIIRQSLPVGKTEQILALDTHNINESLIAGMASKTRIQYPGRWSVTKIDREFNDNDAFLKACKFKWAFNIKPDIVIHLNKNTAICIEAKLESGQGKYPSLESERKIFRKRIGQHVTLGQLEVQRYLMKDLLGLNTRFIYLGAKEPKDRDSNYLYLQWQEVFDSMNMQNMPLFAQSLCRKFGTQTIG